VRQTIEAPVLIVGGGPIGLSAAIALRRLDIDCLVVERHSSTSKFPKARGLSPRAMEIYRQWGMEEQVTDAGLDRDQRGSYVGETLLAADFRRTAPVSNLRSSFAATSPTDGLTISQDVLEPVLRECAVALGADVRFDTQLRRFEEHDDGILAEIEEVGGVGATVACSYLVGADGGRSAIREAIGVGVEGPGFVGRPWISILVEADLGPRMSGRLSSRYRVQLPAPGALFGALDNELRWLMMRSFDPAEEPADSFTEERCCELVRQGIGDADLAVRLIGRQFWHPQAIVAAHFRRGPVFLAGDAAHITTPNAGLGMNTGIGDVHNLAWKLSAVLRGWGGPRLLDTYEPERLPVARWSMEASVKIHREQKRRQGFPGIELGYRYESDAIVADGTPPPASVDPLVEYVPSARPGHRAPHIWLDEEKRRSVLDLFGAGLVVLTDASGEPDLEVALDSVADAGIPVKGRAVTAPGWTDLYGVNPGGMVLVRPDGHVAWRSRDAPVNPSVELRSAVRTAVGLGGCE
jgi:putative polyketide hydroxylase